MAVAEDLEELERVIRQVQIEWEKFFGGVERKPPHELKTKVEALIRRHANAEIRNNTERFRYQNLTARYNTFSELWTKRLRAIEEGRPLGFHGRRDAHLEPVEAAAPPRLPPVRAGGEVRVTSPERDAEAVRTLFDEFTKKRQETGENPVKFDSFQKLIAQQASRILAQKGAQAVDFRLETKDGKVSLKARPVK